jgi:RES domain-containing protein
MTSIRPANRVDPRLLTAWHGIAWCHVPADEAVDPERLVTMGGDDDRWNGPGEPTLYLAVDIATAVAEFARHLEGPLDRASARRRLLGLRIELDALVDLRLPRSREVLDIVDAVMLRDRALTRDVARRVRSDEYVTGLLVPSVAFLDRADDTSRGNLVLFVDRIPGGVQPLLRSTTHGGIIELRAADDGAELTRA